MMTIEELDITIDIYEGMTSCPFTLIDQMSNDEFEFFLKHDRYQLPTIEIESIINVLNIILSKGGDHDKEMIIYKILSGELQNPDKPSIKC